MDEFNKMPDSVREVFDALKGDKMLFGSRSMASRWVTDTFNPAIMIGNKISVTTDWDIAAEFTDENIKILEKMGFVGTTNLYHPDDLTQEIYCNRVKVPAGSGMPHLVEVQVILRNNNRLFMDVWESVTPEFFYNNLWKRGPKYIRMKKDSAKSMIQQTMNQLYASKE
jgi:hypothetical protein